MPKKMMPRRTTDAGYVANFYIATLACWCQRLPIPLTKSPLSILREWFPNRRAIGTIAAS